MSVVQKSGPPARRKIERLENGDSLHAGEFLRRFEAMPQLKKAELVEGIVYMGSPVSAVHSEADNLVQTWLGFYSSVTPGTKCHTNTTVRLDTDNVFQPDALLRLLPEKGGRTAVGEDGYLTGAPELVVEIAASSASIDLGAKRQVYRRAGVREYLIWQAADNRFDWWCLERDDYQPNPPDASGLITSRVFPGLVMDSAALLALDAAKVLAALQAAIANR
ncbi:MAG: Uma2 family endonuclease [Verrucomicrobiota bacterium]